VLRNIPLHRDVAAAWHAQAARASTA